jgi:hypothetical protein
MTSYAPVGRPRFNPVPQTADEEVQNNMWPRGSTLLTAMSPELHHSWIGVAFAENKKRPETSNFN